MPYPLEGTESAGTRKPWYEPLQVHGVPEHGFRTHEFTPSEAERLFDQICICRDCTPSEEDFVDNGRLDDATGLVKRERLHECGIGVDSCCSAPMASGSSAGHMESPDDDSDGRIAALVASILRRF